MTRILTFAATAFLAMAAVDAADWPQWQGPDRTRISKETGLLQEWPAGGPHVIWTANRPRVRLWLDVRGRQSRLPPGRARQQQLRHRAQSSGWQGSVGEAARSYRNEDAERSGAGPRGTPTVDGDRLYVLTENGDLACLKTDGSPRLAAQHPQGVRRFTAAMADQRVAARRRTASGGDARRSGRGHGEAGQDDGEDGLASKDLSDTAAYSSIIVADVQGVRTYMTFTATPASASARRTAS